MAFDNIKKYGRKAILPLVLGLTFVGCGAKKYEGKVYEAEKHPIRVNHGSNISSFWDLNNDNNIDLVVGGYTTQVITHYDSAQIGDDIQAWGRIRSSALKPKWAKEMSEQDVEDATKLANLYYEWYLKK